MMDRMQNALIGACVGLARATDGNEHLITADLTAVICACLNAEPDTPDALETWIGRIEEAKRKIVPDCFLCACPCGRTSAYDLSQIERKSPEIREMKYQILSELCALAKQKQSSARDGLLYRGLIAVGMDDCDAPTLYAIFKGNSD